jgi:hypothetical protein
MRPDSRELRHFSRRPLLALVRSVLAAVMLRLRDSLGDRRPSYSGGGANASLPRDLRM